MGAPVVTDVWVDPANGNDANNGSARNQALRTLAEAWRRFPLPADQLEAVIVKHTIDQLLRADPALARFTSTVQAKHLVIFVRHQPQPANSFLHFAPPGSRRILPATRLGTAYRDDL